MDWIALQPASPADASAWGWQALRFTPRVARVDEAWLLEVSGSLRLFGGPAALRQALLVADDLQPPAWAEGATSLLALALLRLQRAGRPQPRRLPDDLPLALLTAAEPHLPLLARTGCHTWGQLRALPRAPVARRFGATLLEALDRAWGLRPDTHAWLVAPEVFDESLELPALATEAAGLMAAAWRLLGALQRWLQARQQGVLAFELAWTFDLRRLDGVALPRTGALQVRTAEPVQAIDHLGRLLREQLARVRLTAPANHLRLRSVETRGWAGAARTLLPDEVRAGEPLHQLVERLSARLGEGRVRQPRLQADWRPEAMQRWEPAVRAPRAALARARAVGDADSNPDPDPDPVAAESLLPAWLLDPAQPLEVRDERPWYQGPLQLLTRRQRVETGWWEEGGAVVRDYCIARSAGAGLVWIYCEHAVPAGSRPPRWYLQGLYA
jgi:protein ImuB